MLECPVCGMEFSEEKRLKIHSKTHENSNKDKAKNTVMPDFEKPDFSHVM